MSDHVTVPWHYDGLDYFLFKKNDKTVLARGPQDGGLAEAQTFVDPTDFGDDQEIEEWWFGPDRGQVTVCTRDPKEIGTIRVVDCATSEVIGDPIENCVQGASTRLPTDGPEHGPDREALMYYAAYENPEDLSTGYLKLRTGAGLAAGNDVPIRLPPNPQKFTFIGRVDLVPDGEHLWLNVLRWHGNGMDVQILTADVNAPGARPDRPEFTVTETTLPSQPGHGLNVRDGYATFATTDRGRYPNGVVFRVPMDKLHLREEWGEPLIGADPDDLKHLKGVSVVGRGEHEAVIARYNHHGIMALEVFGPDGRKTGDLRPTGPATGGSPSAWGLTAFVDDDGRPVVSTVYSDINGPTAWRHVLGRDGATATETRLSRDIAAARPEPIAVDETVVPFTWADGRRGLGFLVSMAGTELPATSSFAKWYALYHSPELRYGAYASSSASAILRNEGSVLHVVTGPIKGGHDLALPPQAVIAAQRATHAAGLTRPETAFVWGVSGSSQAAAVAGQLAPREFGGGVILGFPSLDWSPKFLAETRYGPCQENEYAFGDLVIADRYSATSFLLRDGFPTDAKPRFFIYSGGADTRTPASQAIRYAEEARKRGAEVLTFTSSLGHKSTTGLSSLTARVVATAFGSVARSAGRAASLVRTLQAHLAVAMRSGFGSPWRQPKQGPTAAPSQQSTPTRGASAATEQVKTRGKGHERGRG